MCGTIDLSTLHLFHTITRLIQPEACISLVRNLEASEVPVYSVKGHKEIINSIDGVGGLGVGDGSPEIVTGSRDGWFTIPLRVVSAW